jgi:hypothetical protein
MEKMEEVTCDDEDESLMDDFSQAVFGFESKLESLEWIKTVHHLQWVFRPA